MGSGTGARRDESSRWAGVHGGGMVVGEACLYTLRHERTLTIRSESEGAMGRLRGLGAACESMLIREFRLPTSFHRK